MKLKDMQPIALTLLLAAVLIGLGMIVLDNLSNTARVAATFNNQTITADSTTYVELPGRPVLSILSVYNATNGTPITFNYSVDRWRGIWIQDASFNGRQVNVSYTFNNATGASTAIDNAALNIGAFATSYNLLIIVLVAALIIGVVMFSIGRHLRR